jgi:hypothetical protein
MRVNGRFEVGGSSAPPTALERDYPSTTRCRWPADHKRTRTSAAHQQQQPPEDHHVGQLHLGDQQPAEHAQPHRGVGREAGVFTTVDGAGRRR